MHTAFGDLDDLNAWLSWVLLSAVRLPLIHLASFVRREWTGDQARLRHVGLRTHLRRVDIASRATLDLHPLFALIALVAL